MDKKTEEELIDFLNDDVDTLVRNIGSYVTKGYEEAGHHPPGEDKINGAAWLQEHWEELRTIICSYQPLQLILAGDNWETMQVIAAVIDGINSSVWHNVPVTLIAAYLFKFGIKNLCRGS